MARIELGTIDDPEGTFTVDANNDIVLEADDASVIAKWLQAGGTAWAQRGDPTTAELDAGQNMLYNSDGSGTGAAGDLVFAINDAGTIKTTVVAAVSNATA